MSGFSAAISEHPVTAVATGEVAGAVFEEIGAGADLALVFVTPAHGGALEDIVATVDEVLQPFALLGAVAACVVGPAREVERGPGISLWAGRTGPVTGVRLTVSERESSEREFPELVPVRLAEGIGGRSLWLHGWPDLDSLGFEPRGFVLLADPFSFPAEEFLETVNAMHPGLPVIGGMASGASAPGTSGLALGRSVSTSGAVGALLGPGSTIEPLVSQGSRPFGRPLVVTRSEQNVIYELAGKPALERLVAQASADLDEDEVELLAHGGLQIGRVMNEHLEEFSTGDFLIRNVLGTDRRSGAVAVGHIVPVGVTVQFHLRDAAAADLDLTRHLAGREADAALLFTCTGRGTRLFGGADHDAAAIAEYLGPIPLAGFFAAGEIGPVAGQNFLHGFTASMALFGGSAQDGQKAVRHGG